MRTLDLAATVILVAALVISGYVAQFYPFNRFNNTSTGGGSPQPKPIIDGIIEKDEYLNSFKEADVTVYWYNDETLLYIALRSPGKGWVSVGIGPIDAHYGANYIFAAMDSGETTVSDQYGDARYSHVPDTTLGGEDNIVEYAGNQGLNGTVIEFSIPLDSKDKYDTKLSHGDTVDTLVAYQSTSTNFTMVHTKAGFLKLKIN